MGVGDDGDDEDGGFFCTLFVMLIYPFVVVIETFPVWDWNEMAGKVLH